MIEKIERYLNGLDYETFAKDEKTIDATIRELEIIGEASNNFSDGFKNKYFKIPFRDIINMRNLLIHEYFGVNKRVVWETCKENLKELKKVLAPILKNKSKILGNFIK